MMLFTLKSVLGELLFLASLLSPTLSYEEVCYDHVGCFSNFPPFDNTEGTLPEQPSKINPRYRLYKSKWMGPVSLSYTDPYSAGALMVDPKLPTVFIIHGYSNTIESTEWIHRMTNSLLDRGNYNVIQVGWNADYPRYTEAATNARLVGKTTALLIDMLGRRGLDPSKIHLVGHSLGAQIAGYVGSNTGFRLGRITGLDPAGYFFDGKPPKVRLDPTDAKFVDVIHTNGYPYNKYTITGLGTSEPCGHVDYYPNGGKTQPGCTDGLVGAIKNYFDGILRHELSNLTQRAFDELGCSHGRSIDIFLESIKYPPSASSCSFVAYPCTSYKDFSSAKCLNCGGSKKCDNAGIDADTQVNGRTEYFNTLETAPLCAHHYIATFVPDGDTNNLSGKLTATFTTSKGQDKVTINSGGEIPIKNGLTYKVVVTYGREIKGPLTNVLFRYDRDNIFARRAFSVKKFEWEKISGDRTKYETTNKKPFEISTTAEAYEPMAVKRGF